MNNYLSLNLVSGKLGRVAGGGKPRFILDEQNEVQLYVLDFPKPSTYPPDSLADAYAYEIIPRDFSGSSVTLRAGVRGGSAIISTNSFFNLPTNLVLNSYSSVDAISIGGIGNKVNLVYNAFFSISSIPASGSLFSFTVTATNTFVGTNSITITSPEFSFDNKLSEIKDILYKAISYSFSKLVSTGSKTQLIEQKSSLYQASDYSYSFYANELYEESNVAGSLSLSVTLNNVSASSNPGKYGYLDFSSSSWDSVIGTKVETPIWIEAMIGSDTIAQGNAIICRKMT